MTNFTVADVVKKHAELSAAVAAINLAHEVALREPTEKLERLEAWLDTHLKQSQTNSIVTKYGKVMRTIKTAYIAKDMGAVHEFMRRTGNMDLLQRRIKQEAVTAYLDETGELPAGITTKSEYVCKVSKLTKAEMERTENGE